MFVKDDISVYSRAYYLQYAGGDAEFADYLRSLAEERAERNRKLLKWKDGQGREFQEELPEDMWETIRYTSHPEIQTEVELKPEPTPEPTPEPAPEPTAAEVEAEAELKAAQREVERDRNREIVREKCMLAAEARRESWTRKRKREDEEINESGVPSVPSLKSLAEVALQAAFEAVGDSVLEMAPHDLAPTPYMMNGELCRVFANREEGC